MIGSECVELRPWKAGGTVGGAHHSSLLSDGETQALCHCAGSPSWRGAELGESGLPHLSPVAGHAVA